MNATSISLSSRFSNFADAWTDQIRFGFGRMPNTSTKVFGVATETVPVTVGLLALAYTTFGAPSSGDGCACVMIIRSWLFRGQEMSWKSSILALLYNYRRFAAPDGTQWNEKDQNANQIGLDTPLMTGREMEKDAQHVWGKFFHGQGLQDDQLERNDSAESGQTRMVSAEKREQGLVVNRVRYLRTADSYGREP